MNLVNFNDPGTIPGAIYSGQVTAGTLTYDQVIGKALGEDGPTAKAQLAGVQNPGLAEMPGVLAKSDKLPSFWVSGPVIGDLLKSEDQIMEVPDIADTYEASFVNALAGTK